MSTYFIFGVSFLVFGSIIGGIAASLSAKGRHHIDKNGIIH